jgi:hypothetical protein
MSNYTKATNFATKDTLPVGDTNKKVKGTEIDDEFNSIATAVNSKADTNSPALTGVPTAPTATTATNTTQVATTAFVQAQKASMALTGTPTAPTATTGTDYSECIHLACGDIINSWRRKSFIIRINTDNQYDIRWLSYLTEQR